MNTALVKSMIKHVNSGLAFRTLKNNSLTHVVHSLSNYMHHENLVHKQSISKNIVPTMAYLELSSQCNRDCVDCYISKESRQDPYVVSQEIMDSSMKRGKDLGITMYTLLGGEPVTPRTAPLIKYLLKNYPDNSFFVCTNSDYLASKPSELENIFMHDSMNIVLSIDGMSAKTHDSIRGKNSYNNVIKAANILHQNKRVFGCIAAVRPENYSEVTSQNFIDWIISQGHTYVAYAFTDRITKEQQDAAMKKIDDFESKPIFVYSSIHGPVGQTSNVHLSRMLTIDKYGNLLSTRRERNRIGTLDDDWSILSSNGDWLKKFA